MVTDTNFEKNENPTFIDGCNIGGKRGIYVKGENVIHLDTPEICFPENAPLHNTDKRELYAILDELFQGGSGGGDDDWSPPEWWIPVPEPEAYDIYILIQVKNAGKKFSLELGDLHGDAGMGTVHYDWGDGTEEIYTFGPTPSHAYAEMGQYLVHLKGDKNAFFFKYWGLDGFSPLILKTGSEIAFQLDNYNYSYNPLFSTTALKYIKINHPKGVPAEKGTRYFMGCWGLQKLELVKKISGELPQYIFQGCYALKNLESFIDCNSITKIGNFAFGYCYKLQDINFPNCTEIVEYAFGQCYNLIHANLPSCTAIGDYGFSQCFNLQEIKTADGCTFGTNCFQNCYSLYPRPDGSVI